LLKVYWEANNILAEEKDIKDRNGIKKMCCPLEKEG